MRNVEVAPVMLGVNRAKDAAEERENSEDAETGSPRPRALSLRVLRPAARARTPGGTPPSGAALYSSVPVVAQTS
jgi:hypothetical protein